MRSDLVTFIQRNEDILLNVVPAVLWCVFFVAIMDRETLIRTWFMPLLGLLAAFLANSVPIGGGIVYIPALSLLGANITLGAAFTISVMPIGNGIFGFLRWILKDPSVIIWESFQYTVIPSWVGSLLAMFYFSKPDNYWIKLGFGWFCFLLGLLVLAGIYHDGLRNIFFTPYVRIYRKEVETPSLDGSGEKTEKTIIESTVPSFDDLIRDEEEIDTERHSFLGGDDVAHGLLSNNEESQTRRQSSSAVSLSVSWVALFEKWVHVIVISFFGGLILVPNIGIGPALITYILLVMMGYPDQHALVTGIVTGGWVCVVPFFVHVALLNDIPWHLWIMVLPGVFYGAKFAPYLIDMIGSKNVMGMFSLFLFASALLYWFH